MPVYEYKCTECTERFEIEQKISDDALTSLEGCQTAPDGEHRLKKVFSSIGISFKGDGFYRNDARGGKKSSSAPSSSGSTPDTSSSSSGTSSTSPETASSGTEKSSPSPSPAPAASSSD